MKLSRHRSSTPVIFWVFKALFHQLLFLNVSILMHFHCLEMLYQLHRLNIKSTTKLG
ncbi:hypothetical protein SOVF_008560 [Spinacia oleracea]|nr:hypothetical protein SOVF_008560 [Spinacia oleracea]